MAEQTEASILEVAESLKEIALKASELADRVLEMNLANKTWPAQMSSG